MSWVRIPLVTQQEQGSSLALVYFSYLICYEFWSGTLRGTRQPLRLHLEKSIKTDFEGEFTPFPVHIDEIVVRFAMNGKIIADTLRSYISYAKCEEDADGMLVHQWDRNEEEPVHE